MYVYECMRCVCACVCESRMVVDPIALYLTAIMCCRVTTSEVTPLKQLDFNSHSLIVLALSMVSAVVKVLDTTMTKVFSGFSPCKARETSTGSTLARKRRVLPAAARDAISSVRRASKTNSGPRKDPPIPMASTLVRCLPVAPFQLPFLWLACVH